MPQDRSASRRAGVRLVAAFFVVPPILGCLTFVASVVLVYAGAIEGAEPVDAALAIAAGIGILAIVVIAFGAIPVVAWFIRRGPLSLRQLLLAGAALGNAPFAVIVLVVTITHLHGEPRFGDIGRYWYGLSGALVRIGIGLLCGTTSAAVFWAVGVRGSDLERGRRSG
jgi:hypothetical protein